MREGLKAGDKVVINGLTRLQPGMKVKVNMAKLGPRAPDTAPNAPTVTTPPSAEAKAR